MVNLKIFLIFLIMQLNKLDAISMDDSLFVAKNTNSNYWKASYDCRKQGSYLATIANVEENDEIWELCENSGGKISGCWIGYRWEKYNTADAKRRWESGYNPATHYTNFENNAGNEVCTFIKNKKWYSSSNCESSYKHYICDKVPSFADYGEVYNLDYIVMKIAMPWGKASKYCQKQIGTSLASRTDKISGNDVVTTLKSICKNSLANCWNGINNFDTTETRIMRWDNEYGSMDTFNKSPGAGDCAVVNNTHIYIDKCTKSKIFVCNNNQNKLIWYDGYLNDNFYNDISYEGLCFVWNSNEIVRVRRSKSNSAADGRSFKLNQAQDNIVSSNTYSGLNVLGFQHLGDMKTIGSKLYYMQGYRHLSVFSGTTITTVKTGIFSTIYSACFCTDSQNIYIIGGYHQSAVQIMRVSTFGYNIKSGVTYSTGNLNIPRQRMGCSWNKQSNRLLGVGGSARYCEKGNCEGIGTTVYDKYQWADSNVVETFIFHGQSTSKQWDIPDKLFLPKAQIYPRVISPDNVNNKFSYVLCGFESNNLAISDSLSCFYALDMQNLRLSVTKFNLPSDNTKSPCMTIVNDNIVILSQENNYNVANPRTRVRIAKISSFTTTSYTKNPTSSNPIKAKSDNAKSDDNFSLFYIIIPAAVVAFFCIFLFIWCMCKRTRNKDQVNNDYHGELAFKPNTA